MIRFTMMPGEDGDCLLLEYGDDTFVRRILVDGGRAGTYPLIKPTLAGLDGLVDLLVVTHVDQDHILGVLALMDDPDRSVEFGDVWFNGFDQLLDAEGFGAVDGEKFTSALLAQKVPWNDAFGGRSVEVGRELAWFDDGSTMDVLSPDRGQLEKLAPAWSAECARNGLIPGRDPDEIPPVEGFEHFGAPNVEQLAASPFKPDTSKTNLTSIGLLFEFEGRRIVLTGDADDRRLVESIRPRAEAEGGRFHLDVLKVAHHGSDHNLSNELLDLIDCDRYLISTSGARHDHPNEIALARILKRGGTEKDIVFNYRDRAALWDVPALKNRFGYTVTAPEEDAEDGFVSFDL
ncbi:ComEC/Rec2 family competence protein [Streptomyces sp. NPDC001530]|uniref:ComEC/Rec2 family competence protein n=1 Tax=Streptomyces sp. NPDC001530 TaxID=3364582 RepID=UPI00367AAF19